MQVAAVLPYMNETVRDMVRLQLLTAMRPAEVCKLRLDEIDRVAIPWRWTPKQHKTAYKGKRRAIFFGPAARDIIEPYVGTGLMFTNTKGKPWTTRTYRLAIWRACDRWSAEMGLDRLASRWAPNRLRKAKLTEIDREAGADASRAVAGHTHIETTQSHYIARDDSVAADAIERAG
jgi:integrase